MGLFSQTPSDGSNDLPSLFPVYKRDEKYLEGKLVLGEINFIISKLLLITTVKNLFRKNWLHEYKPPKIKHIYYIFPSDALECTYMEYRCVCV